MANKVYAVSWTIKFTRYIEGATAREAVEISEDMGNAGAEDPCPAFEVSAMRARIAEGELILAGLCSERTVW